MNKLEKGRKNTRIVRNKVVFEKIKFRKKTIRIEKLEKIWNIPKIISNDIGFQLMFGFDAPKSIPGKKDLGPEGCVFNRYYNTNY